MTMCRCTQNVQDVCWRTGNCECDIARRPPELPKAAYLRGLHGGSKERRPTDRDKSDSCYMAGWSKAYRAVYNLRQIRHHLNLSPEELILIDFDGELSLAVDPKYHRKSDS